MFRKKTPEDILLWAAWNNRADEARRLLAAGVDVHTSHDAALRYAENFCHWETLGVLQDAIWKQDAQRKKERLELERQRNPLLAGTGLTFVESRPEDIDALLRDATEEQMLARPCAPGREYVLFPQP